MKRFSSYLPSVLALAAASALLGGCSTLQSLFGSDKADYKNTPQARPLEIPPDLTQLARDSRYQLPGGVVSASGAAAAAAAAGTPVASGTVATVAPLANGPLRIERAGQQRWLVVPATTPEQLWPRLRDFWLRRGYALAVEDPRTGVMETEWSDQRARLNATSTGNIIARALRNVYDTGERDRFRLRVERTDAGSEIYVSHRGAREVYATERRDSTTWTGRDSDPELEAEMLALLMADLGAKDEAPRTVAGAAASAPVVVAATPAARRDAPALLPGGATSVEIDEPFDRAWRRVGLALDRGGFTVEDRDRSGGLYYVRYVDPKSAGKDEPGFFAKLFGRTDNSMAAVRYRISVKQTAPAKSTVAVQTSSGGGEVGENGQRIAALLASELR